VCQCPQCRAADPIPDYATDRVLVWTNAIARAVKQRHPDKTLLSLGYGDTVKPPLRVKPESNVVVLYCPWFWNSRTSSAVSFDHPLNVVAMKELMGWLLTCPGRVGLYDYPGSFAYGAAQRVKLYARHGVRHIYFNGPSGDRLHWLAGRLIWHPFLDTEALHDEFVQAYYGPAAAPMGELFRLEQEAVERFSHHRRSAFMPTRAAEAPWWRDYYRRVRELMSQAETMADKADDATKARILAGVADAWQTMLLATHPQTGNSGLRSTPDVFKRDVQHYVDLSRRLLQLAERLRLASLAKGRQTAFADALGKLGLTPPAVKDASAGDPSKLFDQTVAHLDEWLTKPAATEATPKTVTLGFDAPGEAAKWLSDGTQPDLIRPAESATVTTPSGATLRGVRITARLSNLPVVPRGNIQTHVGRFYAERVFDPPLDADGCPFLEVHLHSTRDVPLTLYAGSLRADFFLHAGEQIIRLDLSNFDPAVAANWKRLESLAFDLWPQDNYYPYSPAADVALTVLSVTATNADPSPARLPHQGQALWLSQFRPNIPNRITVPAEHRDKLRRQKQTGSALDYDLSRSTEKFRTFTSHRGLSPMYAILADSAEQRAAEALQRYLQQAFGVRLPINPPGVSPGRDVGNVILVGQQSCRQAGWVADEELKYVGAGGFVAHAWQGRIALAGPDAAGTAAGVARYLEDHGVRFFAPGLVRVADMKDDFLHELYVLDPPWFSPRPDWDLWWMSETVTAAARLSPSDAPHALRLAEAIKNLARAGQRELPAPLLQDAQVSPLSRHVATRLLRDPFADSARMIREFPKPGDR
ncbi:MAG: DUF4838 domain-containing protein, partial [Planctomycetes bacterium]|nr:DUF4838 domain-containing protein [Planctomycetota bacterium]